MVVTVLPLLASLDIKPGSYPNCVNNTSRGRIAVAILWDVGFDPALVNPTTVLLAGEEPLNWSMNKDVSDDGMLDLVFQFATQDLSSVLVDEATLVLTGELNDGRFFEGSDIRWTLTATWIWSSTSVTATRASPVAPLRGR